jgi:hypothetical protein
MAAARQKPGERGKKMIRRVFFAACLGALLLTPGLAGPAFAESLAAPAGEVVLTISGDIDKTNATDGAAFDIAMLRQFPAREIDTTTYWYEGMQHFKGVSAVAVLESLGVKDGTLTASAPDGYSVDIPMADLHAHEGVFALELNGADLAEEAEGPVWLVFAYDKMTPAERKRYTDWSVWTLNRIKVAK